MREKKFERERKLFSRENKRLKQWIWRQWKYLRRNYDLNLKSKRSLSGKQFCIVTWVIQTTFSRILKQIVEMGDKETDVKKLQLHEIHNSEFVSKLMGKWMSWTSIKMFREYFQKKFENILVKKLSPHCSDCCYWNAFYFFSCNPLLLLHSPSSWS